MHSIFSKISLSAVSAALLILSGCETLDGNLETNGGLQLRDKNGVIHTLPRGNTRIIVKNKTIVFKSDATGEKVKIAINPGSFQIPFAGSQTTLTAAQSGQPVHIHVEAKTVDRDSNTDRNVRQCDCVATPLGVRCFGTQVIITRSNSETVQYLFDFTAPDTGANVGIFNAVETNGSSTTQFGPCNSRRTFPLPAPVPPRPIIIGPRTPGPNIINPPVIRRPESRGPRVVNPPSRGPVGSGGRPVIRRPESRGPR